MADRHVVLKNGAKEIAGQQGKAITFMAKWDYGLAGNSSHIHNSLWSADKKTPLFLDKKGPWGLSRIGQQWAAGLIKYAREITEFLAPFINSYKRFQVGTLAPTRSSGAATTARRVSACAAKTPRACVWSAASAAPTSIPIWPLRR